MRRVQLISLDLAIVLAHASLVGAQGTETRSRALEHEIQALAGQTCSDTHGAATSERAVAALEDSLMAAWARHDTATLGKLVGDDFQEVTTGRVPRLQTVWVCRGGRWKLVTGQQAFPHACSGELHRASTCIPCKTISWRAGYFRCLPRNSTVRRSASAASTGWYPLEFGPLGASDSNACPTPG